MGAGFCAAGRCALRCVLRRSAAGSPSGDFAAPPVPPVRRRARARAIAAGCVRGLLARFCCGARAAMRQLRFGARCADRRLSACRRSSFAQIARADRRIRLGARAIRRRAGPTARPWFQGTCRSCRLRSTSSLLRARSSSDSRMCVVSVSAVKPKVAAPPLIECAARKIAARSSGSGCRDVEIEQQLLHLREQFVRFVEERLIELGDVECHAWVTARDACRRRFGCSSAALSSCLIRSVQRSLQCVLLLDFRQRRDQFRQHVRVERLFDPAGRARRPRRFLERLAGFGREDEDRRRPGKRVAAQCGDQIEAGLARHVLVGQHEVERASASAASSPSSPSAATRHVDSRPSSASPRGSAAWLPNRRLPECA